MVLACGSSAISVDCTPARALNQAAHDPRLAHCLCSVPCASWRWAARWSRTATGAGSSGTARETTRCDGCLRGLGLHGGAARAAACCVAAGFLMCTWQVVLSVLCLHHQSASAQESGILCPTHLLDQTLHASIPHARPPADGAQLRRAAAAGHCGPHLPRAGGVDGQVARLPGAHPQPALHAVRVCWGAVGAGARVAWHAPGRGGGVWETGGCATQHAVCVHRGGARCTRTRAATLQP